MTDDSIANMKHLDFQICTIVQCDNIKKTILVFRVQCCCWCMKCMIVEQAAWAKFIEILSHPYTYYAPILINIRYSHLIEL